MATTLYAVYNADGYETKDLVGIFSTSALAEACADDIRKDENEQQEKFIAEHGEPSSQQPFITVEEVQLNACWHIFFNHLNNSHDARENKPTLHLDIDAYDILSLS